MPRRTPGGRVKKDHRHSRRAPPAALDGRLPAGGEAPAGAGPAEVAQSTGPQPTAATRPGTPAPSARASLLAGVRRPARPGAPTLATDYAYVRSDLRRIGILAGSAFALEIILAFVIPMVSR